MHRTTCLALEIPQYVGTTLVSSSQNQCDDENEITLGIQDDRSRRSAHKIPPNAKRCHRVRCAISKRAELTPVTTSNLETVADVKRPHDNGEEAFEHIECSTTGVDRRRDAESLGYRWNLSIGRASDHGHTCDVTSRDVFLDDRAETGPQADFGYSDRAASYGLSQKPHEESNQIDSYIECGQSAV